MNILIANNRGRNLENHLTAIVQTSLDIRSWVQVLMSFGGSYGLNVPAH